MNRLLFIPLLFICSVAFAAPSTTSSSCSTISGTGFGTKTDNGEGRSHLNWIWDNGEDYETFSAAGWTASQCVPNAAVITEANLAYSTDLTANQAHSHSTKYITGSHSASGFSTGGTVALFAGGTDAFTKVYARWYYYEEAPFTYITDYNVVGLYDMRNNKNLGFQDRDSLYAGGGTGISYSYIDNQGTTIYTTDFAQVWIPSDYPLHTGRSIGINGFGETTGDKYGTIPNGGRAGFWELWEVEAELGTNLSGSVKLWIDGVEQINFTNEENPFDVKGFAVGGFRDEANNINFRKYFDDVYIDKGWERVYVSSNADGSGIREIQIPTAWSDTSISVTWNQGGFEDEDPCYLFVVDSDGVASNGLAGRFVSGNFIAGINISSVSGNNISGSGFGTQEEGSIYVYDKIETEFNDYWEYTGDLTISGGGRISGNCANMNFINGQNNGYLRGSNLTLSEKWFVSYWFYLENDFTWGTSTFDAGSSHLSNVKVFRLWAPQSSIDESFFLNTWGWGNTIAYKNEGTDSMYYCESGYQTNWEKGTWINFQFQFGESSAITVADGTFKMWRDGQMVAESDDHVTRTTEEYLKRPYNVGFYNSWNAQAGESDNLPNGFRLDDAYVSNTWQRVEVGNNAVYGSCTHREIQIPQEWTDTEITVTWNQGSFEDREAAYLFVIDVDGNVSNGLNGYFVDNVFYISETVIKINGAVELHGGIKL